MVLRVAVSQRKRLALSRRPTGAAGLYAKGNGGEGVEVVVELFEIDLRVKRAETVALPGAAEPQKFQAGAIEDDTDVEKFFAVDTGNDADDSIFKQVRFLHGWPPLQRSPMRRYGLPGIGYIWIGYRLVTGRMTSPATSLREGDR